MKVYHYLVQMDEHRALVFFGGRIKSGSAGNVWMCGPTGNKVFEVNANQVSKLSRKETEGLIAKEMKLVRDQQARSE